jgi:co-chaperonin GroES (HSP10)
MGYKFYDKKLKAVGDKVAIRKLEIQHERKVGRIIIPGRLELGANLCKGIVESVGPEAAREGLKAGDCVLFDHYSTFGETYPVCVTKIENVVCICGDKSID